MKETRPVRESEQLDWAKVAAFLGMDGEIRVEQFGGGHSNLTYALTIGGQEMVLRRPPFGPVPARAHDMAREYRVLAAVHPHFPLAPKPLALCEDTSIIGSVFYVMERRHGIVIHDVEPPEVAPLRAEISASVVDTLAALHAVTGLESLGKGAGFVGRQIRGWTERWHGSKTSEVLEMESLAKWLEERVPPDPTRMTLVHGDYKLDNIMFDARDPARVVGVFDWEMSAVGDPLIDVGLLICYWVHIPMMGVTSAPGWYTREQILERYGRPADDIAVYEVFALFKVAVVIQQIYARFVRGQTDDPRFKGFGAYVETLARKAVSIADRAS